MKQKNAHAHVRDAANMQVSHLSFADIPHQSKLFVDYQRDPLLLRRYYPNAVESITGLADHARNVLDAYESSRERLCAALGNINREAGGSAAALSNIDRLRSADTVAVVTGQQAGLFTGPLYTIYKAMTAIKIAKQLSTSGVSAVPVFWAATEDHDLEEVSSAAIINSDGHVTDVGLALENAGFSVGGLSLGGIEAGLKRVFEALPKTKHSDEVRSHLSKTWTENSTFGSSFLKTIAYLFRDHGLIVLDPLHPQLKELAAPIYERAITRSGMITERLVERSRELTTDGYTAQVLVQADHVPMFWHDDAGVRRALKTSADDGFTVKGSNDRFAAGQLASIAREHPDRLSPGVMLRSVVQDYILPTVCYVGGGAEVAYFAQSAESYRTLDRPVTPIIHRQSYTLVDEKERRVLDKLGLGLADLFRAPDDLFEEVASSRISPQTGRLFADVEERINTELNRLDQALSVIDPTVAANLATRRRKMIYHIGALKKKTLAALVRQDETAGRRLASVTASLLPKGALQERAVNVFSYLDRCGPELLERIYQGLDADERRHVILDI